MPGLFDALAESLKTLTTAVRQLGQAAGDATQNLRVPRSSAAPMARDLADAVDRGQAEALITRLAEKLKGRV